MYYAIAISRRQGQKHLNKIQSDDGLNIAVGTYCDYMDHPGRAQVNSNKGAFQKQDR